MIENVINQTMSVWQEPGSQCEAIGPRPTPTIIGQTVKDRRATLAVMLCQELGATVPAITQATGVGEDTQRLIAERRTEDSKRLESIYQRVTGTRKHA
ncbi:hypothetical protein HNR62_001077 [Oceanisphaera litoralis]|uniref:hypothetical protein n=1 Tax=Oceanisphaera litoralis TaxID=225144 RepID=UPI001956ECCC|nr:hypothetical protein [Oceanisphaera litoralis]MBM7455217.1 hypothetical protein [Oceanisphaera litoralis]